MEFVTVPAVQERPKADAYPSRVKDRPEVLPRLDPIVYGASAEEGGGPLSAAQLREFENNGFLSFPGFLSEADVGAAWTELNLLRKSSQIRQFPGAIVEPQSDELRSLFAVHELSDFFYALSIDERLTAIASQIVGSEVYVHQSRINLKPGFEGKEFYWHSDFETWHIEDGMPHMRAVSFSIALTPNYTFNGPLMLIPGSHRKYIACVGETPESHYQQSLKRQQIGVPDDALLRAMADEGGIEAPTGPAGSLTVFDCNTMHGSNSNITPFPRSNVFFVFNSVENHLTEPYCGLDPRPSFIASRR